MLDLLCSSSDKILPKNPIDSITQLVTKAIKSSSVDTSIQQHIFPHTPQLPKIYGQSKVDKPRAPLRPIVSAMAASTHSLGRYLAIKFQQCVSSTSSFIKYFIDFIPKTKNIHVDEHDNLVKFDVVSISLKSWFLKP